MLKWWDQAEQATRVLHEDVFVDARGVQARLRAMSEPARDAVDSALRLAGQHAALRLPADELGHGGLRPADAGAAEPHLGW